MSLAVTDDASYPGTARRRQNVEVRFTTLDPVKTCRGSRTPTGVAWRKSGTGLFTMVFADRGAAGRVMCLYPYVTFVTATGGRGRCRAEEWPNTVVTKLAPGVAGTVVLP